MGFFADIAQGLGQSTLNRQQTELLRFLEEERFKRQQEAQIQAENREQARQISQQKLAFQTQLATSGLTEGEEGELLPQVDPQFQEVVGQLSDLTQRRQFQEVVQRGLTPQSVAQYESSLQEISTKATELNQEIDPSLQVSIEKAGEDIRLREGQGVLAATFQSKGDTNQVTDAEARKLADAYGDWVLPNIEEFNKGQGRNLHYRNLQLRNASLEHNVMVQQLIERALVPGVYDTYPQDMQRIVDQNIDTSRRAELTYTRAWSEKGQQYEEILNGLGQEFMQVLMSGSSVGGIDLETAKELFDTRLVSAGLPASTMEDLQAISGLEAGSEEAREYFTHRMTSRFMQKDPMLSKIAEAKHFEGESVMFYESMTEGAKVVADEKLKVDAAIPVLGGNLSELTRMEPKELLEWARSNNLDTSPTGIRELIDGMRLALVQTYGQKSSPDALFVNQTSGHAPSESVRVLTGAADDFGRYLNAVFNDAAVSAGMGGRFEHLQEPYLARFSFDGSGTSRSAIDRR